MRFHVAMDSIEKENRILKYSNIGFMLIAFAFAGAFMKVSQKDPLIVERGCFSKILSPVNATITKDEVKSFLSEAIGARFNSDQNPGNSLTSEQMLARQHEQEELEKQKMQQVVVLKNVEFKEDDILVETDRLISVGDIRSAFRFPLQVAVKQVPRSENNPYGLVLSDVKVIEEKKPSQK